MRSWRAQSVSFLWRRPWSCAKRSEGASAVRNGKAQTRPAQGIGASSMTEIQRRPLAIDADDPSPKARGASAARDEVAAAGAHRVAVDATGLDLGAPAALDRLVDTDDHRPVRDEGAEQKMQQAFGGSAARPAVPVEHAMEVGEARYRAQPQDAQGRGDGPPSGRQDGAGEQHQQVS